MVALVTHVCAYDFAENASLLQQLGQDEHWSDMYNSNPDHKGGGGQGEEEQRDIKKFVTSESAAVVVQSENFSSAKESGFRMPRRIHPYSDLATSMYLAQEGPIVAPRAFKVEQLPSTPQLNKIMDRAMGKVKNLLKELEKDKGKPLVLHLNA